MTDLENSLPAGGEPMTEDAAADLIMGTFEQEELETETGTETAEGAAAGEAGEGEEGHEPDESSEAELSADDTEEGEYYDLDKLDPDMSISLRDGTRVRWGDLKRNLAEAQEIQRHRQELNQRFNQFQQTQAQLAQQHQYLNQVLPQAIQILQGSLPEVPPMPSPALVQTDYFAYQEQLAAHLAAKEQRGQKEAQLRQMVHAQQAGHQEMARRQQSEQTAYVQDEQRKLVDAFPDLRDEGKRAQFLADVRKYGRETYGFSDDEIGRVADHRTALVLRDAIAYRKLQAQKPKAAAKAKSAPPVQRPGKRVSESEQQAVTYRKEMDALRKSGSMDDAAALILNHHLS